MRHHMFKPAVVAAGLAIAVGAAVGTADAQAGAHPPAVGATTAASTPRTVFLATGEKLLAGLTKAVNCPGIVSIGSPIKHSATSLRTLTVGAAAYAFPQEAMPYLNHGLDTSLFNIGALAAVETGGRLPVRMDYSGKVPSLPGVTITGASGGVASGYLTAAGAVRFGAALARQVAAGRSPGALLPSGVSVALAGASGATQRPDGQMVTLTLTGTNRAGQPDTGGRIDLFNADNSSLFDNPLQSIGTFYKGVAKFSVPPGHYWAVGDFARLIPRHQTFDEYLDVLPQFTVGNGTTVHLTAQAATSEVKMATAKRAVEQYSALQLVRYAPAGPPVTTGWIESDGSPNVPAPSLFINPTTVSPTVGKLATATTEQLGTSAYPASSKYLYNVAFQSSRTIPSQQHVIKQASLATVHVRHYSAVKSWGLAGTFAAFPFQRTCPFGVSEFFGEQFPAQSIPLRNDRSNRMWLSRLTSSACAALVVAGVAATTGFSAAGATVSGHPARSAAMRAACPPAGPRQARCYALYAPQAAGRSVRPGAAKPVGWGATDIESAYKLPVTKGAGHTVAIVDAYSTPHLASDLAVYRKEYGLPPCTTAGGCLRIVNQEGKASPLPQPTRSAGVWRKPWTSRWCRPSARCARLLWWRARRPPSRIWPRPRTPRPSWEPR